MLAPEVLENGLPGEGVPHGAGFNRIRLLIVIPICLMLSGWILSRNGARFSSWFNSSTGEIREDQLDSLLQRVASASLGQRRGTLIVMDPQSGRIRAVVNSKLAFDEAFRPGSTIKPFTTLAALRSSVIGEDSRTLCREQYSHDEYHTTCSHPRDLSPLNPTEAIAYSCNYYFCKLGERLPEPEFASTLNEFGFGRRTGLNVTAEASGQLVRDHWRSQNAIGEGDYIHVTPIQLINAYNALVNGGHLFKPFVSSGGGFMPQVQANLAITDEQRALIVKGMRGAVRYGTAETANLYSVPLYVFGKTGTATEINGFRTQGWFVGFGTELKNGANQGLEVAPEKVSLAVLVFLAKAHGSDSAQAARPIFDAYADWIEKHQEGESDKQHKQEPTRSGEVAQSGAHSNSGTVAQSLRSGLSHSHFLVNVHSVRENLTREISLEEYVRGVVAAEGSTESEIEALKALAIASRTYALKNMGRHAQHGYDFCSTTHCQRYLSVDVDSSQHIPAAVVEAVGSTRGEVLSDAGAQLVDSYFSASCGGATANMATLWGGTAPVYLRGIRDDYCTKEPHHSWTDVISLTHLQQALKSDRRTNMGNRLLSLTVSRRDASGRAELIDIEGDRRVTVKGWDFKIIVGRALGWNYLKSSRFQIARSGSNFVFRGQGFGHGLGLCQEGAHVMAARGAGYRQILAKYFPGTSVAQQTEIKERHNYSGTLSLLSLHNLGMEFLAEERTFADPFWTDLKRVGLTSWKLNTRVRASTKRQTLRSEKFRVSYPGKIAQREIENLLVLLDASRQNLISRVAAAGITVDIPALDIFVNESTGDFIARTGQPAWAAAATKGHRIELQPLETLKRRRVLQTTLRHEMVHAIADILGRGRTPRWLAEGLALYFAGEGKLVSRYAPRKTITTDEIERMLSNAGSSDEMRLAYAAAYAEVARIIKNEGEANVWRRVAR
ncbi:MAG: SpoIID/LytB domain-containing protein [Pyrinomonadaceae bacterium]